MSSSAARSYLVAASVGAVEALKDQGFARWNYTIRSLNHHLRSSARRQSCGGGAAKAASDFGDKVGRTARSEEEKAVRVMEISCWGPSTVRF